jgi:uncharacterized protein (TIGR03086 family)
MDQLAAHRRAQLLFESVLANVSAEQWTAATPCQGWTVGDIADHVIGANNWVQGLAGQAPVAPSGDKSADVAASGEGAQATFAAEDGLSRMFELPFGTMPGRAFIGLRTNDLFVHAWDVAKATGQSTDLDADLAAEGLAASRQRIGPEMRGEGRPFGAEMPCPDGRPVSDQLAAFLGRVVD